MQTLNFDKEIYPRQAIRQAILDYQPIANINYSERNNKYICTFARSCYSMEQTMDEFSNYVLALTAKIERGRNVD